MSLLDCKRTLINPPNYHNILEILDLRRPHQNGSFLKNHHTPSTIESESIPHNIYKLSAGGVFSFSAFAPFSADA